MVYVHAQMQGLAESDVESLAVELKAYTGKLDDQRSAFTSEHQREVDALQAELNGIHTQIKKLLGKYDDIPPATPTATPTATA